MVFYNIKNKFLIILFIFLLIFLLGVFFNISYCADVSPFIDISKYNYSFSGCDEYYNAPYHLTIIYCTSSTDFNFYSYFGDEPLSFYDNGSSMGYNHYYWCNKVSSDTSFFYHLGSSNVSNLQKEFDKYSSVDFSKYYNASQVNLYLGDYDISTFFHEPYFYIDCNFEIKFGDEIVYTPPLDIKPPHFETSVEELEDGSFDYLRINSGDLDEFYLFSYYYATDEEEESGDLSIYPRKEIFLFGASSKYYVGFDNGSDIYEVPYSDLGLNVTEGHSYGFKLATKDDNGIVTDYWDSIKFDVGVISDTDKQLNSDKLTQQKLDEQTNALNKGFEGTQQAINDSTNRLLDDSYDESSININTSSTDDVDDTEVTNFLNRFIETIKTAFTYSDNSVSTVILPLPHGGQLELKSNLISSFVGEWFKNIINLLWYFIFGKYLWSYSYKLVMYIKDGSLLEGKSFSGEAITSEML